MRVTCVQFEIEDGAPDANLARAIEMLRAAPRSDVLLLPELFTTGYSFDVWDDAADQHTPGAVKRLRSLAGELETTIVCGMISRNDRQRLVNRLWSVSRERIEHYDKCHLIAAFREPELLECGTTTCNVMISGATTNLSICFDLRFPEFYRAAALDGAEAFLVISEWPAVRTDALLTLAKARAIENQAYLALCNRTGMAKDGTAFEGRSTIFAPDGTALAQTGSDAGYCTADLDVEVVRKLRKDFPVLKLSRRTW